MVHGYEIIEGYRLETAHPRISLINSVPRQSLLHAAYSNEALARVALERTMDVMPWDRERTHTSIRHRLDQDSTRESKPRSSGKALEQDAQVARSKLYVPIELHDVGVITPLHAR